MIIKKLKLRNYRNYASLEFYPDPKMNVITGKNGQGKTNLLESLFYLSLTRSFRIRDDKKLIRFGSEFCNISCIYQDDRSHDLDVIIHPAGKTLMLYKQPVKKSSEFIGKLKVVLFSPDDLNIFTDGPKERRKVLNQEISKVSPKYLEALNIYQSLLKNRNVLLKKNTINTTLLDTLDEQIAEVETMIIKRRYTFCQKMNTYLSYYYHQLSEDQNEVSISYQTYAYDENHLKDVIMQKRKESRDSDMYHRVTMVGCHKDDMIFKMNDMDINAVASQGQKRMTILAFKMALMKFIEEITSQKPILLLDDVLSELDTFRQNKLLEMIHDSYQCFITTTEIPVMMKDIPFSHFVIEEGNMKQINGR